MHQKRFLIIFISIIVAITSLACRLSIPDLTNDIDAFDNQNTSVVTKVVATVLSPDRENLTATSIPLNLSPDIFEEEQILTSLYTRVNPSVVNITTFIDENGDLFAGSQGSGFVFDGNGHIVTNAHVVHGSSQIDVAFSDESIQSAEIIGEDLHSDLAVIKVDNLPGDVTSLPLGDMDNVVVGQTVIAIGNPFGLGGTLTKGIVSALGRTIPALTSFSIPRSIQTDAAINPGNSGGPLLNLNGEVIGVNAQIQTDGFTNTNRGVGFAIPVSIVSRVIPVIIEDGYFDWAWLGVMGTDLTPSIAAAMDISDERGAYMSTIIENGPAGEAGLIGSSGTRTIQGRLVPIGGDVIIAINGEPVNSFDDLLVYIALKSSPGDIVSLKIIRDGKYIDVDVKLDSRPESVENLLP